MEKEAKKSEKGQKKETETSKGKAGIKTAGMDIAAPAASCNDMNCPFHSGLPVRGRIFTGIVIRSRAQKTAIVEWKRRNYMPKYERYEKRWTKINVHNPPCINANKGDIVRIIECRPLSKTKHFVIIEKAGRKEKIEAEDVTKKEVMGEERKETSKQAEKGKKKEQSKNQGVS